MTRIAIAALLAVLMTAPGARAAAVAPDAAKINPEVATPPAADGTLNPEVDVPQQLPPGALNNPQAPGQSQQDVPVGVVTSLPTSVPSLPIYGPGQTVQNPNPQSQVSGPAGAVPPGVATDTINASGQPAANVNSGMHAPALGPKTGGAGQAVAASPAR